MTFNRVEKDGRWYFDLRGEPEGTWYSSDRGVYLIPDIIIDAIESGFESTYGALVMLHEEHPEMFTSDYQDVRDVMLADEWIYDEYERFESWINDSDKFLIDPGYYIGMHPDYGDFGMWFDGIAFHESFKDERLRSSIIDLKSRGEIIVDENDGDKIKSVTGEYLKYDEILTMVEEAALIINK